jgi:hypothetical protein
VLGDLSAGVRFSPVLVRTLLAVGAPVNGRRRSLPALVDWAVAVAGGALARSVLRAAHGRQEEGEAGLGVGDPQQAQQRLLGELVVLRDGGIAVVLRERTRQGVVGGGAVLAGRAGSLGRPACLTRVDGGDKCQWLRAQSVPTF